MHSARGYTDRHSVPPERQGHKEGKQNDHGDHYVRVTVEVPRNLTKEQKEKLRDYEKSLGEKNYAKRKTFFDKLKDKFK